MEEHINQIGLKREDAIDRVEWCNGVYEQKRGVNPATSVNADKTGFLSLCNV